MPKMNEPKLHKSQDLLTSSYHPSSAYVQISSSSDPLPPFLSSSYPPLPQDGQNLYYIEHTPTPLLVW